MSGVMRGAGVGLGLREGFAARYSLARDWRRRYALSKDAGSFGWGWKL
jgi:hypothetical protein